MEEETWVLQNFDFCCTVVVPARVTNGNLPFSIKDVFKADTRVSQKKQKSEFCYATNPSGFHRLDEPPGKNSAL